MMGAVGDNLPPDIAAQLPPQFQAVLGETRPGLLTIGALGALWAATGGIGALQTSLNAAYDVPETRNFFAKTGVAVGLTLLGSAGILVAFVTIVGGSLLTQEAVRILGVPASTLDTIALLRWPLMLVLVALAVAVLLRFAPNVAVPFRWPMVGGWCSPIGWVVATALFAALRGELRQLLEHVRGAGRRRRADAVVLPDRGAAPARGRAHLAAGRRSHAPERIAARQAEIKETDAGEAPSEHRDSGRGVAPAPIAPRPEVVMVAAAARASGSRRRRRCWRSCSCARA